MTVYEEIYPEKKLANRERHALFLRNLKLTLPKDREVVIIADATRACLQFIPDAYVPRLVRVIQTI